MTFSEPVAVRQPKLLEALTQLGEVSTSLPSVPKARPGDVCYFTLSAMVWEKSKGLSVFLHQPAARW